MWFGVISIFPEMFDALTEFGVTSRAIEQGKITVERFNPRDYTTDNYQTVDDRPYGGGPGMIMKIEPVQKAIEAAKAKCGGSAKVIYLSPQGKPFNQQAAEQLAQEQSLILLAGRYEGVDERLIKAEVDEEWSLGDFVLSGGELPAMAMMDAVIRLKPGVLGHELSAVEDSFVDGLLDCPHYTRPEVFQGDQVPEVLLSGNHEKIRRWRLKQSLGRTWQRRPDLLESKVLTQEEQDLLAEFKGEVQ